MYYVADGNGERIRGIFRFNRISQPRELPHHQLHLMLFRASITHDARLDRKGRILADR